MVQFNPYCRPTTNELLKHRVFDKIRLPTKHVSKYNILIDIDTNEHKQDYELKYESNEMNNKDKINVAKIAIIRECFKFTKMCHPAVSNFL